MSPDALVSGGPSSSFLRFMYTGLAAMGLFINSFEKYDREKDRFFMGKKDGEIETYDFIIVGGGTAGLIVANRLSEKYQVLALEAGGEPFPLQSVYGLAPYMMGHKGVEWNYKTVPQREASQSLNDKRSNICTGKGLGGSSNMGFINYLRGAPLDYSAWVEATNDDSWGYPAVLPYFKRIESYQGIWKDSMLHGVDGELPLEVPPYRGLGKRFISAGMEMGYAFTDLNGLFTQGFDYILSPLLRGYRASSVTSYLKPIRGRGNLEIRKFSEVQRILFYQDRNSSAIQPTAYGVVYSRHGKMALALSRKEIILSAGSVNSPKILLQSGISPTNATIVELPVGKNLQDHLVTLLGPFATNSTSSTLMMDRDLSPEAVAEFGVNGAGVMSSIGLTANAILRSSSRSSSVWADLHLTLSSRSAHSTLSSQELLQMYNLREDLAAFITGQEGVEEESTFFIIVSLGRPHSRGTISLDPLTKEVLIEPAYLSDPRDVRILVDGIEKALDLIENSAFFRGISATLSPTPFPPCEDKKKREYWECYVREFSMSGHNLVGTVAMGKEGEGVVDSQLRVKGVKALRVIDASVIPRIPVGGTLAATMMIGEKGSEMTLSTWDEHGG